MLVIGTIVPTSFHYTRKEELPLLLNSDVEINGVMSVTRLHICSSLDAGEQSKVQI